MYAKKLLLIGLLFVMALIIGWPSDGTTMSQAIQNSPPTVSDKTNIAIKNDANLSNSPPATEIGYAWNAHSGLTNQSPPVVALYDSSANYPNPYSSIDSAASLSPPPVSVDVMAISTAALINQNSNLWPESNLRDLGGNRDHIKWLEDSEFLVMWTEDQPYPANATLSSQNFRWQEQGLTVSMDFGCPTGPPTSTPEVVYIGNVAGAGEGGNYTNSAMIKEETELAEMNTA